MEVDYGGIDPEADDEVRPGNDCRSVYIGPRCLRGDGQEEMEGLITTRVDGLPTTVYRRIEYFRLDEGSNDLPGMLGREKQGGSSDLTGCGR